MKTLSLLCIVPLSLPMANNSKGISDGCDSDSLWYDSLECEGMRYYGNDIYQYTTSVLSLSSQLLGSCWEVVVAYMLGDGKKSHMRIYVLSL